MKNDRNLPETVEAVLLDMVSHLRESAARAGTAKHMIEMIEGVAKDKGGALAEKLAEAKASHGDVDKHIRAVEEAARLIENLRVERMVEAAGGGLRGLKPKADAIPMGGIRGCSEL